MAYVIVEFNHEYGGGLAAIHRAWLTPLKKEVFWPPFKEQQRFDRALRLGEPVDESWKLYGISRVFYETDDVLKVRRKLKEAEETSNLESEQEGGRQKRKRIRRKLYDTSSDEETNEQNLPRPPPVKRSNVGSVHLLRYERECTNSSLNSMTESDSLFMSTPKSTSITNGSFSENTTPVFGATLGINTDQTVTDKLVSLISHVKEQNDQILAWIGKQNNVKIITEFGMPNTPFSFPLQTVEELDELNGYIRDNSDKYTALVSYLSSLGGNTVTSKANRIFKHIISDTVACKFNYYGLRSQKRAFSDLIIKDLIVTAVKRGIPNSTNKEIEDALKVWLKHSKERLKKLQNRLCQKR